VIVRVSGIENFVGNIKARYRSGGIVTDAPEQHHAAFAEQLQDATLVDSGIGGRPADLVAQWEADPRTLVADMVALRDGRVSWRLYEVKR
jgi:hypothetical protein